jgi:hypothetical protein
MTILVISYEPFCVFLLLFSIPHVLDIETKYRPINTWRGDINTAPNQQLQVLSKRGQVAKHERPKQARILFQTRANPNA